MARIKKTQEIDENNAEVAASIDFDNVDDVVPIDDEGVTTLEEPSSEAEPVRPRMEDPAWTDWVLAQFEPGELDDGRPKVHGLRRMVRKLIGPIIESYPTTKQVATLENEQRATVEYTVVVLNRYNLEADEEEPYPIKFGDVADAWRGNIPNIEFARFPPQMACTRAESRALRKLLCLDVVASEEITDQPLEESGFSGKITESQITKIDVKCQQFDIDVLKFINIGKTKYTKIEDVSNLVAVKMFGLINVYQQYDENKPVTSTNKPIPENIKGYNPQWRGDL